AQFGRSFPQHQRVYARLRRAMRESRIACSEFVIWPAFAGTSGQRDGSAWQATDLLLPPAAAEHLDLQIANLFAQRVAVHAEQIGGADLVAARGRQGRRQ